LQKVKQFGVSQRRRALARRCTALEKLLRVNSLKNQSGYQGKCGRRLRAGSIFDTPSLKGLTFAKDGINTTYSYNNVSNLLSAGGPPLRFLQRWGPEVQRSQSW
jgi:hypothetical protein